MQRNHFEMAPERMRAFASSRRRGLARQLVALRSLLRWHYAFPVVFVGVGAWFAVMGDGGMLHTQRIRTELMRVQRQVLVQEQENDKLRAEVERLRYDEPTVRRAIAEELQLVEAGSTVYRFPDPALDLGSLPARGGGASPASK